MSDGVIVIASAQGLLDDSSGCLPLRLALLLSRMLLDSPRIAPLLEKPSDPEPDAGPLGPVSAALAVTICNGGTVGRPCGSFGSLLGLSTHPAGVGGMGPKVEIGCGRRVGGGIIGSLLVSLVKLCDLELVGGGGPGGGGGKGIPGSHLLVEMVRERDPCDDGVTIAPAEAALLDDGGLWSTTRFRNSSALMGSIAKGGGLLDEDVMP